MAERVEFHDPVLGEVTFADSVNPELDEYSAEIELEGLTVELTLYSNSSLEIQPAIESAKRVIENWPRIKQAAVKYIADHIIPSWIDIWHEANSKALTAEELYSALPLGEIITDADGKTTL